MRGPWGICERGGDRLILLGGAAAGSPACGPSPRSLSATTGRHRRVSGPFQASAIAAGRRPSGMREPYVRQSASAGTSAARSSPRITTGCRPPLIRVAASESRSQHWRAGRRDGPSRRERHSLDRLVRLATPRALEHMLKKPRAEQPVGTALCARSYAAIADQRLVRR